MQKNNKKENSTILIKYILKNHSHGNANVNLNTQERGLRVAQMNQQIIKFCLNFFTQCRSNYPISWKGIDGEGGEKDRKNI